ncbi:MAG TPA: DUF1365 domain-containing protein [Pseudohaliea sp.]|nr:DUF1365 domain-containing protein [Pseudohaliea sp.]
MKSRLYTGLLRHRRHRPREHAFAYRVFMLYLCLDELPTLFDRIPCWSARRRALGRYRREDFLGDPAKPLADEVRRRIREETGREHRGPIYLLANLRYFGIQMNPICCYYCFSEDEARLDYLVAEVTNTPWNERHSYVLPAGEGERLSCDFDKALHVSPFNPMAQRYHWRSNTPGRRLGIYLGNSADGEPVFDATLALTAQPLSAGNLNRMLLRYPFMTAKVAAAIYWEALKLFLKRVPLYPHPAKSKPSGV